MEQGLPSIWRKFSERYKLQGNHCQTCKKDYFPARLICPQCRRKGKLTPKIMPWNGKIVSYTEVFVGPTGFEHETPYFLALVELDNKVKLLSQIVDSDKDRIKIGARVKKIFRKIGDSSAEGAIAYGYKFKVVE